MPVSLLKTACSFLTVTVLFLNLCFSQNARLFPERKSNPVVHTVSDLRSGGPMIIDTVPNLIQFINNMLFGSCISISNLTYSGSPEAIGYFVDTTGTLGMDFGLLMTSGSVFQALGPNNSSAAGKDNNDPGDPLLTSYANQQTYDASILEFDFVALTDSIGCEIVFGSEEYMEYVGSYNDVFGFYISGPSISGTQNIALVPNTTFPISVNNVNGYTYSQYYVDNTYGSILQYDGFTTVMKLRQAVIPGQTYHFKVAIADAGDGVLDSGVFIKAASFMGTYAPVTALYSFASSGLTVNFFNSSSNASKYFWDFGDGTYDTLANPSHTYSAAAAYTVMLIASNICTTDTAIQTITLGTSAVEDKIEGIDYFKIIPTSSPATWLISFQKGTGGKKEISVYNMTGQRILHQNLSRPEEPALIDLHSFGLGVYIVQVKAGGISMSRKLLRM